MHACRSTLEDPTATLFSAGAAIATASSLAVAFPPDRDSAESYLAELRSELDEAAFEQAWAAGQELEVDGIADLVRRISELSGPS